ncbi:MAG TPA: right-handed parallel beta-helix repeat-containing protein, partial [Acidimicrobiales bacterium]|nr:right-handed parallel beta-helix repeat-containing protein [Acidimicrobiales bacterium]
MKRRGWRTRTVLLSAAFATVTGPIVGFGAGVAVSPASAAVCTAIPAIGFNAAMVVNTAGTVVNGNNIDAAPCDLGIYVAPGANNVTITGVTVTGANDHGIMAEQVSGLTIQNSTVDGNGVNPNHNLGTDKAIQLVGVTGSTVSGNTVFGNLADGGISVTDEGGGGAGFDPAAPLGPTANHGSSNDTITNNYIHDNFGGCAIVIESWIAGPGAGVDHITASNNTITGHQGQFGPHGPVIGQIVVAGDAPGASVTNTTLMGNTIIQSFLSGITLHSNAPGDVISGTLIQGNLIDGNNWAAVNGAPQTDGIALEANDIPAPAPAPVVTGTTIDNNFLTNQYVGVWQDFHVTGTSLTANNFSGGAILLYTQPVPGKGYWMAGGDGGIFTFGDAGFFGSEAATPLDFPVVGMTQTRDQGGYVFVGADGTVFPEGDASDLGSPAGTPLNAPVVGISMTPAAGGPPGTPGTNGLGYWIVAGDGGIFTYGDAKFFGSTGAIRLNKPVVGIAPTPDGLGYWTVASDGGIFTFG